MESTVEMDFVDRTNTNNRGSDNIKLITEQGRKMKSIMQDIKCEQIKTLTLEEKTYMLFSRSKLKTNGLRNIKNKEAIINS